VNVVLPPPLEEYLDVTPDTTGKAAIVGTLTAADVFEADSLRTGDELQEHESWTVKARVEKVANGCLPIGHPPVATLWPPPVAVHVTVALFDNPVHPVRGTLEVLYVTSQLAKAHPAFAQDDEPATHVMTILDAVAAVNAGNAAVTLVGAEAATAVVKLLAEAVTALFPTVQVHISVTEKK
jgi:hypothetical protein